MKRLTSCFASLLVIALLFLAFNLAWAPKLPQLRLDTSTRSLYTLSPASVDTLAALDRPIDLYFFNSKHAANDLPPPQGYARRVEELLKTYASKANGQITLHVINPVPLSDDAYRADLYGLEAFKLPNGEKGYFGLVAVNNQHTIEVIAAFNPSREAFLEYEISRLVYRMAHPQKPRIGFMSDLPMESAFDERKQTPSKSWAVMREIRRRFDLMTLSTNSDQIPRDVNTLMLVHPKYLPKQTLYAIDQFVLRGGKLLVFLDPLSELDTGQEVASGMGIDKSSGLAILLNAWGLQMVSGKVLGDRRYATSAIMVTGQPPQRHPTALTLPAQALNQADISTIGLSNMTLLSSGALKPVKGARTTLTPLLQSSDNAMLLDVARLEQTSDVTQLMKEIEPHGEPFILAARVTGFAKSAFPEGLEGKKTGLKQTTHIHVIVVADTDLLSDRMWLYNEKNQGQTTTKSWSDNATFVLNALDNLSGPQTQINLRTPASSAPVEGRLTRLRREADETFAKSSKDVEQRRAQMERALMDLRGTGIASDQDSQHKTNKERLRLQKQLQQLRSEAYGPVDALTRRLTVINILLIPLLLACAAIGILLRRRSLFRNARHSRQAQARA